LFVFVLLLGWMHHAAIPDSLLDALLEIACR